MIRDTGQLEQGPFDLLIIGGGIYGAWTAYDAALRGLKVALVEKGDWASGTSSASSKLIHGGLRYLEQFKFGLVRTSLEERKLLARLAPHRVTPLKFLIPVYKENPAGPLRLKAGLLIYDLLAGKNQPVDPHQGLGRRDLLSRYPFLKEEGLKAGFTYGDCQMDDARFTLEIIEGANRAGAITVNYAEVKRLIKNGKRITGAVIKDRHENRTVNVLASLVINTAGPWAPLLSGKRTRKNFLRLNKGVHLVMPPLPTRDAILIMVKRDKRIFFMIPWYGKTLLGTTDTDYQGNPDNVRVEKQDIDYLLTEANRVFNEPLWDRSSILGSFAGLRALRNEPGKAPSKVTREWSILKRKGLLISVGGKFTSARADAAKLVDRAMQHLHKHLPDEPPTQSHPFPWSPGENIPEWKEKILEEGARLSLDPETVTYAMFRYGTSINNIFRLVEKDPALSERLVSGLPFCKAEVIHCASEEMVLHLEDLLRRRIPLLILARPDRNVLEQAAALAAKVLGWTDEKCDEEVDHVIQKWSTV